MNQHLIDEVVQHRQKIIDRIVSWSSIPSGTSYLEGLDQMKETLIKAFAPLNAQLEIIPLSPTTHEGDLPGSRLGEALLFSKRPEAATTLFLGGHYDTVYGDKLTLPYWKSEDILVGSGVADMKGGIALMLSALEIFENSTHASELGWQMLLTPDEEIGSPGSSHLWESLSKNHRVALLFEPAYPDGAWVDKRKGSINLKIDVEGRAAHAGRDFSQGRSAIYALASLIKEIENLHPLFEGISLNVGMVSGGSAINIVADRASCSVNMRSYDQQHLDEALFKIKDMVEAASQQEGITVTMNITSERPVKNMEPELKKLFSLLQTCAEELNIPYSTRPSGGCCDGNNIAAAGVPVIDTMGVVGGKIHTSEEYLNVDSLVSRCQCALLLMLKIANGDIQ